MRTMSSRLEFLRCVHRCHATGEEAILLKEFQARIEARIVDNCTETVVLQEDRDDKEVLFDLSDEKQAEL